MVTSPLPRSQLSNLNGPVPVGCSRAYVGVGERVLAAATRCRRCTPPAPSGSGWRRPAGPGRPGTSTGDLREPDDGGGLVRRLAALVDARGVRRAGEAAEDVLVVVRGARALGQALEVVPAVEVEADGLGVEVRAVVELHALRRVKVYSRPSSLTSQSSASSGTGVGAAQLVGRAGPRRSGGRRGTSRRRCRTRGRASPGRRRRRRRSVPPVCCARRPPHRSPVHWRRRRTGSLRRARPRRRRELGYGDGCIAENLPSRPFRAG